jgi:tetratricopeptide (TPR) repeat protein
MSDTQPDKKASVLIYVCLALGVLWLIVLLARSDRGDYFFTRAGFYLRRGHDSEFQGDLDGAIRNYSEAIRANPKIYDGWAYKCRGDVHLEKGDFESAIRDYTEAIMIDADQPKYYYARGNAYSKKGDKAMAKADNARAHELRSKATRGQE